MHMHKPQQTAEMNSPLSQIGLKSVHGPGEGRMPGPHEGRAWYVDLKQVLLDLI